MPADKVRALIGLALRSRSVALGREACKRALKRRRLHALLVASDAGLNAIKDCDVPSNCPVVYLELTKDELGEIVGRPQLAVLGLLNPNLAAGLLKYAEGSPGP